MSTERPLVTQWYSIRQDRVRTHTGEQISYTYIDHPGSVFVVPVTRDGNVLLIRQYRYPVHEWCWEVPGGGIEVGEEAARAAARELCEEVGALSYQLMPVAAFYPATGMSNARSQVYLATEVEVGPSRREPTELLHVVTLPPAEALHMARMGEITDGQSALAVLLCERYLAART
jgi:ADP-ribose pyrophosphatase